MPAATWSMTSSVTSSFAMARWYGGRPHQSTDVTMATMEIRDATAADWPALWPIFAAVVREGETYTYDVDTGYDEGRALWMEAPPARVSVAVDDDGTTLLGTAKMSANRGGNGAHVATASFMVAAGARGRGVGRALGEDMIAWATRAGFRAIQFNAVVASNAAAVALWQSLGFVIVGTVPDAFVSPTRGDVGLHVMLRRLATSAPDAGLPDAARG
jgi:L-amino acid N-acyltransferase YncA